jgi:hypothetical protein
MLLQKISLAFKPGSKKGNAVIDDENSDEKEMTDVAKWVLSTKDGVERVAAMVKKSEDDVKKILTDPKFSRKAYTGEFGYSEISYAIGELKDRDDALKDYAEDSTDLEMNEVAKWALSNSKILKETVEFTKLSEAEVKKILKDPKFSRKVDMNEPGFAVVWNTIAGLKCRTEEEEEYVEDSTDREMLNAAKKFIKDPTSFGELVETLKKPEGDIKRILKDPEFAKKVDFCYQEYVMVSNAMAELEELHEYQNELKEERRKEQQKKEQEVQAQAQAQSAVMPKSGTGNGIYGTTIVKVGNTNKQFIYRKE